MLLHVLGAQGGYLGAALGGAPRLGRIHEATERGEVRLALALHESASLAAQLVRSTTPQEWSPREISSRSSTLHGALPQMLKQPWKHRAELSRCPGDPVL